MTLRELINWARRNKAELDSMLITDEGNGFDNVEAGYDEGYDHDGPGGPVIWMFVAEKEERDGEED